MELNDSAATYDEKSLDWVWDTTGDLACLAAAYSLDPEGIQNLFDIVDDQLHKYLSDKNSNAKLRLALSLQEPLTVIYQKVCKGQLSYEESKIEVVNSLRKVDHLLFFSDDEFIGLARNKDEISFDGKGNILGPAQKADETIGQLVGFGRASMRDFRKSNHTKHKTRHFVAPHVSKEVNRSGEYDYSLINIVLQKVCGISDQDAEVALLALGMKKEESLNKNLQE